MTLYLPPDLSIGLENIAQEYFEQGPALMVGCAVIPWFVAGKRAQAGGLELDCMRFEPFDMSVGPFDWRKTQVTYTATTRVEAIKLLAEEYEAHGKEAPQRTVAQLTRAGIAQWLASWSAGNTCAIAALRIYDEEAHLHRRCINKALESS